MSKPQLKPLARAMALALPALCLLSGAAQAADVTLAPVTVTGTPISNGATTVDKAALPAKVAATSDTASMLSDVPGLSLNGAGGVSSLPSIHGLADDRLRIKVDGMDLIASCPNHMNPALSYITPSNVGTLKVYAGITPVSAGGDSIGGTIIAESRAPEFSAPGQSAIVKGEAGAFYRSNNSANGINLSGSYATDRFNISYVGTTSQADNYAAGGDFKTSPVTGRVGHTLPLDEVGSTAYKTTNHSIGLAFKADKHLFEAKLGMQEMPYQLYPNQRMDMLKNDQQSINLRYSGQFDWGSLQARAYQEDVDHFMDFGADKRFWYGPGPQPGGSGGDLAPNGLPCSPISGNHMVGTTMVGCAAGMPMVTEGKTTGFSVKADLPLNPQDLLRVGGEVQQYRINDYWTASGAMMAPGTFLNIKDGERDRTAIFGEWEAQKGSQWMTLVGARYEQVKMNAGNVAGYKTVLTSMPMPGTDVGLQIRDSANFNALSHEKTDNNLDLTALAKYTANASYDIEFGVAHKVRSPNVYERYTWSTWQMAALMNNFVGDGNGYVGDVNLKPEKANKLSATFDWHAADNSWGFKTTPYYTQVTDYIDAVQWTAGTATIPPAPATTLVKNNFSVLKFVNQSARLYGFDLSGHMHLATNAFGAFGLKGLLNYTKGTNQDTGDELYNIMPLNAKLAVTQQLGGWDNSMELVLVKDKRNVSDMRNEIKTPGYSLLNVRTSYTVKQVRVDFGVENLFNRFYSLPTGGAYTGQGTTMSTTGAGAIPWGTAVPGMGRSIYVGLNVKF